MWWRRVALVVRVNGNALDFFGISGFSIAAFATPARREWHEGGIVESGFVAVILVRDDVVVFIFGDVFFLLLGLLFGDLEITILVVFDAVGWETIILERDLCGVIWERSLCIGKTAIFPE